MSKAFTKEEVDPPERSGRVRAASGLPPGAVNYITAPGAVRLRQELVRRQLAEPRNETRIAELKEILASVTIVPPQTEPDEEVAFGALVTVRDSAGVSRTYRIVGVDEIHFYEDAVSWVSPVGRKLLAGRVGARVVLEEDEPVTISSVEYPVD